MEMRSKGKRIKGLIGALVIGGLSLMFSISLIADGAYAAGRDVEWGGYQNSADNNGVIDSVDTPLSYDEAALKWSRKVTVDPQASFTPPIIIDGKIYTASRSYIHCIDKDSGEEVAKSEKLDLDVGYAMNPITYDEDNDQIYVPATHGRIHCLKVSDLSIEWTSEAYTDFQAVSPVTVKNSRLYFGIWKSETEDGAFICLDVKEIKNNKPVEKWKYIPSKDPKGDKIKRGFYWNGAYVNDNYVIVGADDGTNNHFDEATSGSYTETAVVYSFDRMTGEVKDRIDGIKGDVRSTVVHHQGSIYFVSKGGRLHKAKLNTDGTFGEKTYIQLKDKKGVDALMTSSPVIYNGRIYVGAAGSGGQYNADGGHYFAVIKDDAKLSDSSLIYTVPISGYPQAAPILSRATENSDGKVRLYFTFNAYPGGIYYLEDSQQANATNHESAHLLFRPEMDMQQYCISPLCCDREGTFYYKNDSGYLMAVEMNKAWLNDIVVTSANNVVEWEYPFESGILNYTLHAGGTEKTAKIDPRVPDSSMRVTVDGKQWNGSPVAINIGEETAAIPVEVSKTVGNKTWKRRYTINIDTASDNANLAGLAITASNTKPQIRDTDQFNASQYGIGYDPKFDPMITKYTGRIPQNENDDKKAFLNIWIEAEDARSSVRIIPTNNVGNSSPYKNLNEKGEISSASNGRYPIYWVKGANSAEFDIEVTSSSGKTKKTYNVTLQRSNRYTEGEEAVGEEPMILSPYTAKLKTSGNDRSVKATVKYGGKDITAECTFESTDRKVATVDNNGMITAVSRGEAEIWVSYAKENRRARIHVEVSDVTLDPPEASISSGEYTQPIRVELHTVPGAQIRYVTGGIDEDLVTPTTTSGTVYSGPISIGTDGQMQQIKIRAIACGNGFTKSYPVEFTYSVDLTEDTKTGQNKVSLDPGSIIIDEKLTAAFSDLPNGTTYEALIAKLQGQAQARVTLTPGSNVYGIDNTDPARPFINAPIIWSTEDGFQYYPADTGAQNFEIKGTVILPEGIDAGGKNLSVYLPVTVNAKPAPAPDPVKAPGKVKTMTATVKTSGKKITAKWSAVKGAGSYRVLWRKAGGKWSARSVSGTTTTISGLNKGACYEIKIAAVNAGGQGGYSPSSYCLIQKTGLKVKAGRKSFKATVKKIKKTSGCRLRYSLKKNMAGAKAKSTAKKSITIKKLKARKNYYVQAAPYKKIGGRIYMGEYVTKRVKTKK